MFLCYSGRPGGLSCCAQSQQAVSALALRAGGYPSLTQNPACSSRTGCAARSRRRRRSSHPGTNPGRDVRRNAVSRRAIYVIAACPCSCLSPAFSPFKFRSPGLRQPQPVWLSRVKLRAPQNFLQQKVLRSPRTAAPGRARLRPCGEGSQTGDGSNEGKCKAGPAERQNRGSRNSTGDVENTET